MEKWIERHTNRIWFMFLVIFLFSMVTMNLQFPKELRGGVIIKLGAIESNYAKREEDLKSEINNHLQACYLDKEVIQAQFRSIYEMRNDVQP